MGPWSVDQIPDPHWHGECECAAGDGRTEFRTISRKAARRTNTLRPDRNVVRARVFAHTNHTRRLMQPGYARVRVETVGTKPPNRSRARVRQGNHDRSIDLVVNLGAGNRSFIASPTSRRHGCSQVPA